MSGTTITSPVAYIDDTGIHIPTFEQILIWLQGAFRGIYGDDLYLESDSQDGQLIAILAKAHHDANSLALAVYNGYSPATAQGPALSTAVKLIGMRRKVASYSSVALTIGGDIGAQIVNGVASDVNNEAQWMLPALVTIPLSGAIQVTATAATLGAVQAAPGTVNRIATPTRGWISVTNNAAAVPGAPVETDPYLRQRQAQSSGIPARGITDTMRANLLALPGVLRVRIYENSTGIDDMLNGVPGGSVGVVVEGGDTAQIAQTILLTKGQGRLVGDTRITAYDTYGIGHLISFWVVQDAPVTVTVQIKPLQGYTTTIGSNIATAVATKAADPINGSNGIGETVFENDFYSYAKIDQTIGGRTYTVQAVTLSAPGVAKDSAGNLLFTGPHAPTYAAENVKIVLGS